MKKLAIGLGILFLLALAMPVLAAGAVVTKGDACSFWVPEQPYIVIGVGKSVVTPSGNELFTCKGQLDPTLYTFPKKALTISREDFPGISCYNPEDTWSMVITPSGQASLVCQIKAPKAP